MLAQAAEERPLLLGVDDAQWLDLPTLEALVFSVRRMHTEPIAVLLTAPPRNELHHLVAALLRGVDLRHDVVVVAVAAEVPASYAGPARTVRCGSDRISMVGVGICRGMVGLRSVGRT